MKKFATFTLFVSILALIAGCESSDIECIRASTTIISETRDVKDFTGVVCNVMADVSLMQDAEFYFKVTGPDNVIELTTTTVQNNLLIIGTNECFNGNANLSIEISAPDINFINLSGLGTIETVGNINTDIVQVELYGIGEIDADFQADSLYTTISGTGVVNYGGEVYRHIVSSSGIFTLNSYPMITNHTFLSITGVGDSYVNAQESLTVIISGEGNVYYKGDPVIQSQIEGSGEIIDSN